MKITKLGRRTPNFPPQVVVVRQDPPAATDARAPAQVGCLQVGEDEQRHLAGQPNVKEGDGVDLIL